MAKVRLWGDNLLLKKVEAKNESGLEMTGDIDPLSPVYEIIHAGQDINEKVGIGSKVLLKPGSYQAVVINGEQFTFAEGENIAGEVGEK